VNYFAVIADKPLKLMKLWKQKTEELRSGASKVVAKGEVLRKQAHSLAHRGLDKLLSIVLSPVRAFKFLCFSVGFTVLLVMGLAGGGLYSYLRGLPVISKLKYGDLRTIAEVKNRERLAGHARSFRWATLEEINREYLYAIVTSEDSTFFEHSGFNFEAIANSLAENIKEQRFAYGGSTISQQVVKNLFLTNEKTFQRKVTEFLLTKELEARFTKNEILEIYLNIAEFGPDIIGAQMAAQIFFKKPANRVNAAEGAFIALMLPSPKRHFFTIYQNKNLTKPKRKRIERVLRDMLFEEFLTESQYVEYVKYPYFGSTRLPASKRKESPKEVHSDVESD